jgi:chromosomal replication initiation ATPase DnaA
MTHRLTLADIVWTVSTKYSIPKDVMLGRSRLRKFARPRQIAFLLARELTNASFSKIGRHFGRDHSTIVTGLKSIKAAMEANPKVKAHVEECRAAMPSRSPQKALEGYWGARLAQGDVTGLAEIVV